MSKCEDIIRAAFFRAGITAADTPLTASQSKLGLIALQGMYQEFGNGLLGQVTDYYLSSGPYTASEGQRIFKASPASVITIPTVVTDKDTGINRAPLDGAIIIVIDPAVAVPAYWLYNMAIGAWQNIVGLALTDVAPMTYKFDEPLKNILAVILADERGQVAPPIVAKRAALGKLAISNRRLTKSITSCAEYF